jgi:sporulation protein YlmC with PRC-barrel domain
MNLIRMSEDRTLHVASGEPQVQHFGFYDDHGNKIGAIKDLIVDTEAMKVRFLIVSWHVGILERRDLIIPVRDVMVDADAKRVVCIDGTPERLNGYPEYKGGILPDLTKRFVATFLPGRQADETDTLSEKEPWLGKAEAETPSAAGAEPAPSPGPEMGPETQQQAILENVPTGETAACVCEDIAVHQTPADQSCCTVETAGTAATGTEAPIGKTDMGAEPVSKTDQAGDKIDLEPPQRGSNEELGRPDHLYGESRDRPVL